MEMQTVKSSGAAQEIHHNAPLTSSETARLWQVNVFYSMLRCVFKHFSNTLPDQDLRLNIDEAISMFETRINQASEILRKEGRPIPKGFADQDLDLETPRLFTDLYYYHYILNKARIGLQLGSMNLAHSVRADVRDFHTESVASTMRYYNRFSEIMLEKGIYIRPPVTNTSKEADVVERQDFLRGFLGERRPLLEVEIDNLFFGVENNEIGEALAAGFQQVARSEQVRAYMARGAGIARKHVNTFSKTLQKENLPVPTHYGEFVTDSTIPPFSDRLMMQHVVVLTEIGIGNYATAMASSLRHDLSVNYLRLIGEIAHYAEDGINIMIENGWFEEPPRKTDRRDLAKEPVH